jgi:hypothetical protein
MTLPSRTSPRLLCLVSLLTILLLASCRPEEPALPDPPPTSPPQPAAEAPLITTPLPTPAPGPLSVIPNSLAWSPDETWLAFTTPAGEVWLQRPGSPARPVAGIVTGEWPQLAVSWAPDSQSLLVYGTWGSENPAWTGLWHVRTGAQDFQPAEVLVEAARPRPRVSQNDGVIRSVSWAADSRSFAFTFEADAWLYDLDSKTPLQLTNLPDNPLVAPDMFDPFDGVRRLALSPAGRWLAIELSCDCPSPFSAVGIVDLESGAVRLARSAAMLRPWSPDGQWVGLRNVTGDFDPVNTYDVFGLNPQTLQLTNLSRTNPRFDPLLDDWAESFQPSVIQAGELAWGPRGEYLYTVLDHFIPASPMPEMPGLGFIAQRGPQILLVRYLPDARASYIFPAWLPDSSLGYIRVTPSEEVLWERYPNWQPYILDQPLDRSGVRGSLAGAAWSPGGRYLAVALADESGPASRVEILPTHPSASPANVYADPAGQFRLHLPAGWAPAAEPGSFLAGSGLLQTGYLPEMAYMGSVHRVCERLANTPQGPARLVLLHPLLQTDACLLVPLPEMSTDQARLVIANPNGAPQERYIYLEVSKREIEAAAAAFELVHPPQAGDPFPYPSGPLRPEDQEFWQTPRRLPDGGLTMIEYRVVSAELDSPTHFEFLERIPAEVLEAQAALRHSTRRLVLERSNALLEPFGYRLEAQDSAEMELYRLYRGDELVFSDLSYFWPASVNASGSDFALLVERFNRGYLLVRKDGLENWDMAQRQFLPPVFVGEELVLAGWDAERQLVQLHTKDGAFWSFGVAQMVAQPLKGLWSWQGCPLVEVDGFLVHCGEVLNDRLGYDEIFGWQLLAGEPYYYFRKGPRVGISYAGQVLPVHYDEVIHYRCCEPSAFNNSGNEAIAWFYGLRDGTWYYVEAGRFAEYSP